MNWRMQQEVINDPILSRVVRRIDEQMAVVALGTVPTGATVAFDDRFTLPQGWLRCDGAQYPVNDYQALYRVLRNMFGGTTNVTFVVPTAPDTIVKT